VLFVAAAVTVTAGVVLAALAVSVWHRRRNPAGLSLAVLLIAVAWWGLAYALELASVDMTVREIWGDLKYAGVVAVPPAWLTFVLQYTGRARLVTRRAVVLLAAEPLLVLAALASNKAARSAGTDRPSRRPNSSDSLIAQICAQCSMLLQVLAICPAPSGPK